MRVLVYPHAMEIGGSQLNAVDLAAAVRDRGHEVIVYSEPGPLVGRVRQHGLEHILRARSHLRPGPGVAFDLRRVVREREVDVIHGWEWPPILESHAAASPSTGAAVVGSIMSMGVARFLPSCVPITVGTQRLLDSVRQRQACQVALLEPPVDLRENGPGEHAAAFTTAFPAPPGTAQIVIVSRLAHELKLEGILHAVRAVERLAAQRQVRLVIVGDGPARRTVMESAAAANARVGRDVVVLTGELSDPRGAYDAADICLGMGGSALRAMAFGKPLVVQGEGGFFQTCAEETLEQFLWSGWYGIADRGRDEAVEHLVKELDALVTDPARREHLGSFGRRLVTDHYSLTSAAARVERFYEHSRRTRPSSARWIQAGLAACPALASYKLARRWQNLRGRATRDDFNSRPR